MPDNAERVFEGRIFDVYQWQQTMFDGAQRTFEMLKRPDTVQVIVLRGDKILLINDRQPGRGARIQLPGGRSDESDSDWLAAAQRELREETGLVCESWCLIDVVQPQSKIEWFVATFLAQEITAELAPELDAGGEKITMRWMPYGEFHKGLISDELKMTYLIPLLRRLGSVSGLRAIKPYEGMPVDR